MIYKKREILDETNSISKNVTNDFKKYGNNLKLTYESEISDEEYDDWEIEDLKKEIDKNNKFLKQIGKYIDDNNSDKINELSNLNIKLSKILSKKNKELEETTTAGGVGGSYVGPLDKPISKINDVEEVNETTDYASVGNFQYVTPKFKAKDDKNWKGKYRKMWKGGKFVIIKDKCKNYDNQPHCSSGAVDNPITLSDTAPDVSN